MDIRIEDNEIKEIIEDALYRLIMEQQDLFKEIIEDVIEDIALTNAIREGRKNRFVKKEEIEELLEGVNKI